MSADEKPVRKSTEEVRQAERRPWTARVLTISLLVAVIVIGVVALMTGR